jgi:Tfp pilus assembly protein PilP
MNRAPLADLTRNALERVRADLEDVAKTGAVTVPLAEYNQLVDQLRIIKAELRAYQTEIGAKIAVMEVRIHTLEQHVGMYIGINGTLLHSVQTHSIQITELQNMYHELHSPMTPLTLNSD